MPGKSAKLCDYTNCRRYFTRTVGKMWLCQEHATEFQKFLDAMFGDKSEQEDTQNHS